MYPVGSDIYEVDVGAFAQLFIAFFAAVDIGCGHIRFPKELLAGFCALLFIVAQGLDLNARDVCPAFYGSGASHS